MKARTRITLVLAMIAALLAATPGVGAQENPTTEPFEEEVLPGEEPLIMLTDKEVEELIDVEMRVWIEVRKRMGFTGGAEQVADLVRTREGQLGRDAWSVPLTFEERAEMDERALATSNSGEARAVLETIDGYADMYIDHRENGTIFVNFNRNLNDDEAQEVRDLFVIPTRVEVRQVKYSLASLAIVATEVEQLRSEGLDDVTSVSISARKNAVVVGVSEPGATTPTNPRASDGFVEAAKDQITDKISRSTADRLDKSVDFTEMIETKVVPVAVDDGCYGRLNCGTAASENWRGGTGLDTNQSGNWGSSNCTTGFIFNKNNSTTKYISTSGHCDIFATRDVAIAGQNHGEFTNLTEDRFVKNTLTTDWPLVDEDDYNSNVDSDAAMIFIQASRSDNRVYKSYQKKNWYINARNDDLDARTNTMEGSMTCISGVTFGFRCGEVTAFPGGITNSWSHAPTLDKTTNNLVEWEWVWPGNHTSGGGNSGSPMFAERAAHGLHVQGVSYTVVGSPQNPDTEVVSRFSPITEIESDLDVTLCIAAADC